MHAQSSQELLYHDSIYFIISSCLTPFAAMRSQCTVLSLIKAPPLIIAPLFLHWILTMMQEKIEILLKEWINFIFKLKNGLKFVKIHNIFAMKQDFKHNSCNGYLKI